MTCGRKLGPFDCCSVVQGDCLELMRLLPDGCVDAVITDPPYGADYAGDTIGHKVSSEWDTQRPDLSDVFRISKQQVIWGGNYYELSPSRGWLIWHKPDAPPSMADAELAWTSRDMNAQHISHSIAATNPERVGHPTQKPLRVMMWTIEKAAPDADMIVDPYAGSGTTLVAAKKLGRHFLGFEIYPEYCSIARKRIAAVEAQPTLFAPKPEQLELGGQQ